MLIFFVLAAILPLSTFAIDHDVFKDCSRVPFCTNFRNRVADKGYQFWADVHAISVDSSVATIPLYNFNGDSLNLQISLLNGDKARVKILEPNHNRYELSDVLDKEPEVISFMVSFVNGDTSLLMEVPDGKQAIVIRRSSPFSVEFYYNDLLEVTLNSERLFIENTDNSQSFSFQVDFEEASKLYGLHHHAYSVALGETADGSTDPFRLKNSDAAGYEVDSTMALYGAVPVVYGHSTRSTSGVFLHNAAEQWVDIGYNDAGASAHFMADSGTLDLFVLFGPTPKEVVRQFTDLTGVAHLPQYWALGYHQCRYSYETQEDVKDVIANMDKNGFPMDAIWLDIDYTDGKRYFTWNPDTFNDPIEMQKNISSTGRKLVTIIDPHIKVDGNYAFYTEATDLTYFVKWADGISNFQDDCWPGLSSYIDFLNPDARSYYASWYSYERFVGSTETLAGIWNDMNEPSVFDTKYENSMPLDALHYQRVRHRDIHNIYGFLQTMATHQGLLQRDNGSRRPFVLTRSHFAGSQRYAAMWTGDNNANWDYLAVSYSECLTSNIVGMVFCGADIGGFIGNPDVQLFQRWYQAAVWLPFFRSHSEKSTPRREPYLYSEDVQNVIRNAMKLRYKHIPVLYTLFYEHTRYGDPIIRPLFYSYPEILDRDDHLLVGTDILARPVLQPDVSSITVYFPGDSQTKWYRVDDDSWTLHNGGTSEDVPVDINTSPYYYKAGSIIPRKDIERRSTAEMEKDPFTAYVNLDENNNAYGRLYADDYRSFDYVTDSSYFYLNLSYDGANGVTFSSIDGTPRDIVVSLQTVIVHNINGQQTKYTTTSDEGQFYEHVQKLRDSKSDYLIPAAPIEWAASQKKHVDIFFNFIHHKEYYTAVPKDIREKLTRPAEALHKYRKKVNLQNAKLFVLAVFLPLSTFAIDRGVFKDCARVPFCTNFRNRVADEGYQFFADVHAISAESSVATIPLHNSNGDSLNLQISLLSGDKARVKILEPNHNRYELSDVLDKEPEVIAFTSSFDGDTSLLIEVPDGKQAIVVHRGPPFSVEFYYNDLLEVVLNSERLFIENTDNSQSFSFQVNFEEASKLYGLHHHAYSVALGETADGSADPFRLKNSDAAYYEVGSTMALYGAVPVVYGHSTRSTSGIFLHNAAEQWIDIGYNDGGASAHFMAESGTLDLFVLFGPTPKEVVRQFTDLTGVAHLPQYWALGYHQCRYSYDTQEDVKNVIANMDKNDFPMDAIWLDIDYTDGQRYFTWNPGTFSDPVEMQRNISSTGRKLVTIIDPHFKVDGNYAFYTEATDLSYFVKWADGISNFQDQCWPGLSSYIDFLNPDARNYYASWYSYERFQGSTETLAGIWNDMNEPSVFDTAYENSMPSDALHYGGVRHRDIHNIYGFLQTMATHQGLLQRDNGSRRPFVLTRSHFAGSQRYAAMWTGDNNAYWEYLAVSYSECLTSNIVGMVFCGADIGGFFSNPDVQLLQRWYQAAIWVPFFRSHSEKSTPRREPYLYSEDVQKVIRNAIKLRYKHLPVLYTLFYEHTRYGDPIIRPLFYSYPEILDRDDHLLLGTDILARPVLQPDVSSITVFFPGDSQTKWYRVDDNSWTVHNGGTSEDIPVDINTSPYYYKAGSIIPRKDIERRSTAEMEQDPYTAYVNLDENNNAYGRLYADDYRSFDYVTDSSYFYLNLSYDGANGVTFSSIDGTPRDIVVSLQTVIVHNINGQQTKYTTTSDGTSLHTIDIVKLLNARSGTVTLYL